MRIKGNRIILSKKENEAMKQVYREIPYIKGEGLEKADLRVMRYFKLLKKEKSR